MTKEEFYNKMLELKKKHIDDEDDKEVFHYNADCLMCDLLSELGYREGAELFLNEPKWYS